MNSPAVAVRRKKFRRFPLLIEGAVMMMGMLCLIIALTFANFRDLQEANRLNIHTYQVLEQIGILQASFNEEESRLRGYALTGDTEFLADFHRVEANATDSLNRLNRLTIDRPQQQVRLKNLGDDYDRWRSEFAHVDPKKPLSSVQVARTTPVRRSRLERLKDALDVIESTERTLLLQRQEIQETSQRSAAMFLMVAGICALSFCAIILVLLGFQVRAVENANQRLVSSQGQLQAVLNHAPIILYAVDNDEKFTLMAGKGAASIGMISDNVVGKSIVEVIGQSYDFEPVRAALAGGSNVSRSVIKGLIFETNRLPLYDETGRIDGMIGVGLDVSQGVKAETALRESEARFRSVIESLHEIVFQIDSAGRWSFLNPAWRVTLGHDIESSLGKPAIDFVQPDDQEQIDTFFGAPEPGRKVIKRNLARILTRGGSFRWMDAQVQVDWDENGLFKGAAGTLTDITDRKLAQEELLATTSLQKAILNSSNYSIIAVGPDGLIESFNRAAQELLGYSLERVRGQETPLLFHDVPEMEARARELSEELGRPIAAGFETLVAKARGGGTDEREWTYVGRLGERIPTRLSISELRGLEGESSGFVMVGYDLTESRRAESLKNEFVSVVSHELRTPLTSIRGALGLLAGGVAGPLPESARQMIEIARKNSDRLVLLINDILDIEKIESGEMRFEIRELSLKSLLRSAVEQNLAYGEGLGVHLVLASEVEEEDYILGDEDRLQQVLSNLVSNACKFTPSGGTVRITVGIDGEFARVNVRDEGPGVPEEFVPRLFEKFAQADSSSTRKLGGTGLGLAIARATMERQNGSLRYIAPGEGEQGACFSFTLPLASKAVEAEPQLQAGKVLICEDEPEVAELLRLIVSKGGYESDIAHTLAEARIKVKSGDYVGMTLDLLFPDGDGLDLLSEIRADPELRDLPVVVVSLNAREGLLHGESLDVLAWMRKPIDAGRLLSALGQFQRDGSPRVLHVEDDGDVRQVMAAILGESALVTPASTLREARARLGEAKSVGKPFDIAILDIGLPDGSGLELVPELSSSNPPIPIIMFSASETSVEEARLVRTTLVKSRTTNEVLRETIQSLLRSHEKME